MTMTTCGECGGSISSLAKTCPHCGIDQSSAIASLPEADQASAADRGNGGAKWLLVLAVPLGLMFLLMAMGGNSRGPTPGEVAALEERKRECARAMMSSIGRSTVNYSDQQAYEREVREKCDGLTIDGKPIEAPR